MNIYALGAGTLIAIYIVIRFRKKRLEKRKWAYPLLLATFPVYYWAFAIYAGDHAALQKELLFGALFVITAFAAYRMGNKISLLLLAAGYIAHGFYDFKHDLLFANAGTPAWWPGFCGSVDVLLGVYIVYLAVGMKPGYGKIA